MHEHIQRSRPDQLGRGGTSAPQRRAAPAGGILSLQATAGNAATVGLLSGSLRSDGLGIVQRQPAHAPASADRRHADLHEHVHTYFDREQKLAQALVTRKRDALSRFTQATDAAYNKEADSSALSLFSLALSLVPEAGALLGVFQVMTKGTHYFLEVSEGAKKLGERVKSVNEAAKGGVELAKGAGEASEAAEKNRATTDAESRGNFIMAQIDDLTQLEEETISSFWHNEDALLAQLDPLVERGVELDDFLASRLPIPTDVPSSAGEQVSYRFELLLYKQMYADPGVRLKSNHSKLETYGDAPFEGWLEDQDVPEKMIKHIKLIIEPKVPGALELVFGAEYERTPAQTRIRADKAAESAKERARQEREVRFEQGMKERLGI